MKDTELELDKETREHLAKKVLLPKQRRAEPFSDPFLAEILDDFGLKLHRFKEAIPKSGTASKEVLAEQKLIVFRLCEFSRDVILRVWPPTFTPPSQLDRAIRLFRDAVQAIDLMFGSTDLEVTKFRNNIGDRADELEEEITPQRSHRGE